VVVVVVVRVWHGYTAGTDFVNRTRTREHCTCSGYGYIPYCNLHGITRVPAFFFTIENK
jgi:hypothetical protein